MGAAVGFAVSLPVSLLAGERIGLPADLEAWMPLLYLTLVGSVGAYVLMAWLIKGWAATRVSFITLVIPIVAVGLGAAVRDEALTPVTVAGSLLVLLGVTLAARRRGHGPGRVALTVMETGSIIPATPEERGNGEGSC